MAAVNYLNCNGCGLLMAASTEVQVFRLTSCGHVLCDVCSSQVQISGSLCLVCRASCRMADLTHNPIPDVKYYITDPLEMLKECLHKMGKVVQFQNEQRKRFMALVAKLMESEKSVRMERDTLLDEVRVLKKRLESIEQQEQGWIGSGVMASPHGGGNGFFIAPPPTGPSPLFGSVEMHHPGKGDSRASSVTSGSRFGNMDTSTTNRSMSNLTFVPGRLTRQHSGIGSANQGSTSRQTTSNISTTQRLFPTMYNASGNTGVLSSFSGLGGVPGSATSKTSLSTPGLLARMQHFRCRQDGTQKSRF